MQTVVRLSKLAEELNLKNLTPDIDMSLVELTTPDINRPALQLAGFYEHFAYERVQIIGYVEYTHIMEMEEEEAIMLIEMIIKIYFLMLVQFTQINKK